MSDAWPELPYDDWKDTYATLHMWTQVVGKIALAHGAPLNHSWGSALHLTNRGLTTQTLRHGSRSFAIEFDFLEHRLLISSSDRDVRAMPLEARTVADFYRLVMAALREMDLPVRIWTMPVEIPTPIRFDEDTVHRSYDPVYANRVWRILLNAARVLTTARCDFVGKASPAHFFWGSFDLALTRFSGRPAPPRDGPAFIREAYSHEAISHGFWPGGASVLEPVFYAYAAPEPAGFKEAPVEPDAAAYNGEFGEFLLPYDAVRRSPSPEDSLRSFVQSTYVSAAALAAWDRSSLERQTLQSA